MLRLVADQAIPLLNYYFADYAHIHRLPANQITPQTLQIADALLVRSRTCVNDTLLHQAKLQFVGSCVAGMDHLDVTSLKQHNIPFYAARGCNALAVLAYVQQSLKIAQQQGRLAKTGRAAVIGCGEVGQRVANWLSVAGWEVLCYDPPRAQRDATFQSVAWQEVEQVDLICLHSAWVQTEKACNTRMIDHDFLTRQKTGCVLLNAARGELVDQAALLAHASRLTVCLDVWQDETKLPKELAEKAFLFTPHIAGNTVFGRANGTAQVYAAMSALFAWSGKPLPDQCQENVHSDLWEMTQQTKKTDDIESLRLKYLQALPI